MSTYIPVALRKYVVERAGDCCEYCLHPQSASLFALEIEHIIAEKHRGPTTAENLALACPACNRLKGSDLGSIDHETQQLTPLFHPRNQQWTEHFYLSPAAEIIPITAEGRVTVFLLQFNHPDRIEERQILIASGQYDF
jgi:HNH endonuclease